MPEENNSANTPVNIVPVNQDPIEPTPISVSLVSENQVPITATPIPVVTQSENNSHIEPDSTPVNAVIDDQQPALKVNNSSATPTEQTLPQVNEQSIVQPLITNSVNAETIPVVSPEIDTSPQVQNPVVILGQNDSFDLPKSKKIHWGFIIGGISTLLVLVAVILYFWLLPTIWSNNYLSNIKPLYEHQLSQMSTVYQSLNRPVFTSNNTTVASDTQDFDYIQGVIDTATINTNSLAAKNHLTVLPLSTWQHKVSSANNEYQAMQQYISDSQSFLQGYRELVVYMGQVEQIAEVQLPKIVNDISIINKGAAQSVFITDLKTTTVDLQSFSNQLVVLKPPDDLQSFNENLLSDLNGMDNALTTQETELQSNNNSGFNTEMAVYVAAYNDFVNLLNTNPVANISTSSAISTQISNLEKEHPLQ